MSKKKITLVATILLIAIGFAAISTSLIINGKTDIGENTDDFSIIFTRIYLDGEDVYNDVIDDTKQNITFSSNKLSKLGDTSVLEYEIINNSSNYDAEVTVNCVPVDGTNTKYTTIRNELEDNVTIVKAKHTVNGKLTMELVKTSVEKVNEQYKCALTFNAAERDSLGKSEAVSFATDSWTVIAENIREGNTDAYKIGDKREIDLGSLGKQTIRVSNKSECTTETSETACGFVVEFVGAITKRGMFNTDKNNGGWENSEARTYVNHELYGMLPSDLQNVILDTKVISGHGSATGEENFVTTDKLYLLSSAEIWSNGATNQITCDSATNVTKQLDYYKENNVSTTNFGLARKQYNGLDTWYWLRTAHSGVEDCYMAASNTGDWTGASASANHGIVPAFRIG